MHFIVHHFSPYDKKCKLWSKYVHKLAYSVITDDKRLKPITPLNSVILICLKLYKQLNNLTKITTKIAKIIVCPKY